MMLYISATLLKAQRTLFRNKRFMLDEITHERYKMKREKKKLIPFAPMWGFVNSKIMANVGSLSLGHFIKHKFPIFED